MELSNILAIVALSITVIGGAIIQVMFRRAFRVSDDAIKSLKEANAALNTSVESLKSSCKQLELDLNTLKTRFEEFDKIREKVDSIDSLRAEFLERFQRRSEFIREVQILQNQIELIFNKIDHVDAQMTARPRKNKGSDDDV